MVAKSSKPPLTIARHGRPHYNRARREVNKLDIGALRVRQGQWDRFHDWEKLHPLTSGDLDTDWRWYEAAFDLAIETGALPSDPKIDEERIRALQLIRARLARLRWPS